MEGKIQKQPTSFLPSNIARVFFIQKNGLVMIAYESLSEKQAEFCEKKGVPENHTYAVHPQIIRHGRDFILFRMGLTAIRLRSKIMHSLIRAEAAARLLCKKGGTAELPLAEVPLEDF
jgi:hypothetical protein